MSILQRGIADPKKWSHVLDHLVTVINQKLCITLNSTIACGTICPLFGIACGLASFRARFASLFLNFWKVSNTYKVNVKDFLESF